ncbi:MAG: hypothetical protein FJW27_02785 [Acidimicrobiia bacterium]|nr:hypothetical protein [Acidimicrobiia bacterium]
MDVSIFDAQGRETLIVGMVVDYKTACAPPPPPPPSSPLQCTPSGQTAALNQAVNLSATGGTGVYEWSSVGTPSRATGRTYSTAFATHGSHSVVVTSGNATATCIVEVMAPPPPPPVVKEVFCSPATQSVRVNEIARLTATAGNGGFDWSGGGSPATGTSATFETAFAAVGTYPVTVTSGAAIATCQLTVTSLPTPPPPLVCTTPSQSVLVNQPVTFTATVGTGTYAWSVGGTPANASGASFTTAFGIDGTRAVTVESGNASATCSIRVNPPPPPPPPLVCAPGEARVKLNKPITLTATGGTGQYAWSVEEQGGTPSEGTGPSFTTRFTYLGVGHFGVFVTSGEQTAKCKVYVVE